MAATHGSNLSAYYHVLKPGIIYGNSIALIAGFLLASSHFPFRLIALVAVVIGSACIIGSGCVYNNVIERYSDAKMKRTKDRELVTGRISVTAACVYGALLALIGFSLLYFLVNPLTALVGLVGFVCYVLLYTYSKRLSPISTFIGAISGAIPPVAGYTALSNHIDASAVLLFVLLAVWQLPHFFAISIRRRDEYANAGLPVLAVVYGASITRRVTIFCIIAFALIAPLLILGGRVGYTFAVGMLLVGIWWAYSAGIKWKALDDTAWARKAFGSSLSVMLLMSGLVAIGGFLP